jgi:hypothetical protein
MKCCEPHSEIENLYLSRWIGEGATKENAIRDGTNDQRTDKDLNDKNGSI